jgi:hypothetical protein
VALADLAEHVPGRHPDVLQDDRRRGRSVQAHLVLFLAAAHAGERPLDDEGGEVGVVHLGEHDEEVGEAAVGDPHLLAAQEEAAVGLAHRARLGAERVRAGSRLAQTIGARRLSAREAGEVFGFLRLGAEAEERHDRQARLRTECRGERRHPADLLADDHRRDLVEADPTELLGHVGAEEAQLAGPLHELLRERPVLLFELLDRGRHFVLDEFPGRPGDQAVLV